MFDIIKCEYQLPITDEIKSKLGDDIDFFKVNWQTKSFEDCFLDTYTIEDDGQIYKDIIKRKYNQEKQGIEENFEGIEKVDYSGEIRFYMDFVAEDKDYWLEYKALVWKGELREIEVYAFRSMDNSYRKEIAAQFEKKEHDRKAREKSWWWPLFKFWRGLIRLPLGLIRLILGFIVHLTWKIEKLLTGGPKFF